MLQTGDLTACKKAQRLGGKRGGERIAHTEKREKRGNREREFERTRRGVEQW
jgi:hypothetical protein